MGSSQSTRKISVTNDNAHIIKVSESVIERLKSNDQQKETTKTPAAIKPIQPTLSSLSADTSKVTLTSLQVLQEKERQLKENDAYWANRVKTLENNQGSMIQRMEKEFDATVTQLNDRIPKRPAKLSELPCSDKEASVLDCYRKNPKHILLCSQVVADFANCVDQKRLAVS